MSYRARSAFLLAALPLVVAGCGGSGGGDDPAPDPVMTLSFSASPVLVTEGAPIAPPVQVQVLADGVVDTTRTDSITLAFGSSTPGSSLAGTTTVAAVDGVATFPDLVVLNGFGPDFTLVASADGFASVTSAPFTVLQAPATQVVITSVAPSPLAPFEAFSVTVEVRTASGVLQTSASNPVTLSLSGGGPDLFWHASGNSVRVVELIAPSTDAVVAPLPTAIEGEIFGAVLDPMTELLLVGNINSAMMLVHPATGDEVRWGDANTLSDDMKGWVFDDSGVLHSGSPFQDDHFTVDLVTGVDTNVGLYTLEGFTVLGINGLAKHPSNGTIYAVVRVSGGPRRLATLDPSTGVLTDIGSLGDNFSQITFDSAGTLFGVTGDGATVPETLFQINPADATTTADMTLGNGGDGEVVTFVPRRLGGTITVNAVGGVAVFPNLYIDQTGTGYVVTASSPGLALDTESGFDVTGTVTPTATVEFQSVLATVPENVSGGAAQVTLVLSAAQSHAMPVFITIDATSTATAGGTTPDTSQPKAFHVVIPAGVTTFPVEIPIVDDTDVEIDETLVLTIRSARLSAGTGVNVTHVLTIQSNDTP
jgi:hypothetical protein